MLAYVFWHWPSPATDPEAYETDLRSFHAALSQSAPDGLVRSTSFRIGGQAPWLGGEPAYADWYVLETSAALDALNETAVSGPSQPPHHALTRAMAAGAGTLLNLRQGTLDLDAARTVTWLTKPRDTPYADFDATYTSIPRSESASLWRRAFVFGPTPEFGVLSPEPLAFPDWLRPLSLSLTSI
jgi:hypothetical protein